MNLGTNINQISYCGQISLLSAAVNCSYSDNLIPLVVTFILLAIEFQKYFNSLDFPLSGYLYQTLQGLFFNDLKAFKLFKIIHLQEMGQKFLEGNKLLQMVNKIQVQKKKIIIN